MSVSGKCPKLTKMIEMKKTYISPKLVTTEFHVKAVICDGPSPTPDPGGDGLGGDSGGSFAPWRY